jgi:hypothetical protein
MARVADRLSAGANDKGLCPRSGGTANQGVLPTPGWLSTLESPRASAIFFVPLGRPTRRRSVGLALQADGFWHRRPPRCAIIG